MRKQKIFSSDSFGLGVKVSDLGGWYGQTLFVYVLWPTTVRKLQEMRQTTASHRREIGKTRAIATTTNAAMALLGKGVLGRRQ
ncbi:MAG: hypothetical protein AABY76_02025, partial [Planctomycetota bacterium]